MNKDNFSQPPKRPLLEVLAERMNIDRLVSEINEEANQEAERNRAAIMQQERFNYCFKVFLQKWSDKRHGH